MEMPFRVGVLTQARFYYVAFTSTLGSGFRLPFMKLGWKQSVFLAIILSKAKDRQRMKRYLTVEGTKPALGHIARHLFLISQAAKCSIDVDGPDMRVEIRKGGIDYRFNLLAVLDRSRAAFVHDWTPLSEIFYRGVYDFYDYRGGAVVDIGGYIGDTAVYFAKNGAAEVHVYEPNPVNFDYLLRNIELNDVAGKVQAINRAVSMERKKLSVPDWGGAGSVFAKNEKVSSYEVGNIRPTEILNDEERISLLKVDCKGCELELFGVAIDPVAEKAKNIIIDSERLDTKQRSEMVSSLGRSGFSLDADNNDLLYLHNKKLS